MGTDVTCARDRVPREEASEVLGQLAAVWTPGMNLCRQETGSGLQLVTGTCLLTGKVVK